MLSDACASLTSLWAAISSRSRFRPTLVCIVALGEALVIITRRIDLSVGAIVAMSAFIVAAVEDPQAGMLFVLSSWVAR